MRKLLPLAFAALFATTGLAAAQPFGNREFDSERFERRGDRGGEFRRGSRDWDQGGRHGDRSRRWDRRHSRYDYSGNWNGGFNPACRVILSRRYTPWGRIVVERRRVCS